MEIWKDIEGYEGTHQVSNYGRIRSIDRVDCRGNRVRGRILIPQYNKDGYLEIGIKKNGIRKHYNVHRLVAIAFIDNPNNYPIAGHWDDNRDNNVFTNIYWTTIRENNMHNGRSKRIGEKQSIAVMGISKTETVVFKSISEASRNGFYINCILGCLKGKRKTHKGYYWVRIS